MQAVQIFTRLPTANKFRIEENSSTSSIDPILPQPKPTQKNQLELHNSKHSIAIAAAWSELASSLQEQIESTADIMKVISAESLHLNTGTIVEPLEAPEDQLQKENTEVILKKPPFL